MNKLLNVFIGASLTLSLSAFANDIQEIDQEVEKINKVLDKNNAESSCYIDEDGLVENVNTCLNLIKLNTEPKLPIKVAVDTELVSMSVSGDKMIQNYSVRYGGEADLKDPEALAAIRKIYVSAMPTTSDRTCWESTFTSSLYKSGMVNEYRYYIDGATDYINIIVDKQYCESIGWGKEAKRIFKDKYGISPDKWRDIQH